MDTFNTTHVNYVQSQLCIKAWLQKYSDSWWSKKYNLRSKNNAFKNGIFKLIKQKIQCMHGNAITRTIYT